MSVHRLLTVIAVSLALLAGCSQGVSWSDQEKDNARHIFLALEEARTAAREANQLPREWTPQGPAVEPVIDALNEAMGHAAQVRQTVLVKAHPRLSDRFHAEFRPALEQLRDYFRTGEMPPEADPRQAIGEFSDWFYRNQHEFRWWSGYREDIGTSD